MSPAYKTKQLPHWFGGAPITEVYKLGWDLKKFYIRTYLGLVDIFAYITAANVQSTLPSTTD